MSTTDYATYCPEDNKLRLYVGRYAMAEMHIEHALRFLAPGGLSWSDIEKRQGGRLTRDHENK